MKTLILIFTLSLVMTSQGHAMGSGKVKPPTEKEVLDPGEPAYCDPKTFLEKEVKADLKDMDNAHLFKVGNITILGLGVGNSDAKAIKNFAAARSTASASQNYCTWYYNKGNDEAEEDFTHIYLTNPKDLTTTSGPREYGTKLKDQFANARTSYLSCLADHKYIAFGCNGMKHRGPSVFAMILAYSGCSPTRAAKIVNVVWGLNGVDEPVRLSIATEGKKLGDANPVQRQQLQMALGHTL
ncbi:MAG: hypothetical protein AB7F59_01855 [Bdellovibrionales bacterium]